MHGLNIKVKRNIQHVQKLVIQQEFKYRNGLHSKKYLRYSEKSKLKNKILMIISPIYWQSYQNCNCYNIIEVILHRNA